MSCVCLYPVLQLLRFWHRTRWTKTALRAFVCCINPVIICFSTGQHGKRNATPVINIRPWKQHFQNFLTTCFSTLVLNLKKADVEPHFAIAAVFICFFMTQILQACIVAVWTQNPTLCQINRLLNPQVNQVCFSDQSDGIGSVFEFMELLLDALLAPAIGFDIGSQSRKEFPLMIFRARPTPVWWHSSNLWLCDTLRFYKKKKK